MRIKKIEQVEEFLSAVKRCSGNVWLRSRYGDVYNMKSQLSQYMAIAALLGEHGDELELFCDKPADESLFFQFFNDHPEVV